MTRQRVCSNLYPQVCSIDNLYLAWRKARKGKRGRAPIAGFEFNLEENFCGCKTSCWLRPMYPAPT